MRAQELSETERRVRWTTEGGQGNLRGGTLRCIPATLDQVTLVELQYLYAPGPNTAAFDSKVRYERFFF